MITRASVSCIVFFILASGTRASAQCEQTDPKDDVRFEITVIYYDFNPFSGHEETIDTYGPVLDDLTAPERLTGDLDHGLQISNASVEQASGGQVGRVDVKLSNIAEVVARRVDGLGFGNGVAIRIKAWIKGPIGTPYYLRTNSAGSVVADFPDGAGIAETFFSAPLQSGCCSVASVNGAGEQSMSFDQSGGAPDVGQPPPTTSGSERMIDGQIYSLAQDVAFDGHGGILQSINFCFPSCPNVHYKANTIMSSGYVEAGLGPVPTCSGSLEIDIPDTGYANQLPDGTRDAGRTFSIRAEFEDAPPQYECRCCRYRQFVLDRGTKYGEPIPGHGVREIPAPMDFGGPTPCESPDASIECPIEDTECDPRCPSGRAGYGDRDAPTPDCPFRDEMNQYLDVAGGQPDHENGCYYEGFDFPGASVSSALGHDLLFRLDARFVGQIVDTCGSEERVVAQKEWELCFDVYFPQGSGEVQFGQCGRGAPSRGSLLAKQPFLIAGRNASIALFQTSDLVLGSVALPVVDDESLHTTDVNIVVLDALDSVFPDKPLTQVIRALGSVSLMPFAAVRSEPYSSDVELTIDFDGETVALALDLCSGIQQTVSGIIECLSGPNVVIPVDCTCVDTDGDYDVDLADVAAFQLNS